MQRQKIAGLDVVLAGGLDGNGGGNGPMLVLMHGFGAPGDDLVALADHIGTPPEVRFAFPAAPLALNFGGVPDDYAGRAWWLIDMLELQRAVMLRDYATLSSRVPAGLSEARALVTDLLDALERDFAVPRSKLVLGGFSQGAMLATDVTLRAERPPAALAILSGSLICREEWLPLMHNRAGLPVLQSHGRGDPVLSFDLADALRRELTAAGLNVDFIPFSGGHTIPPAALAGLARLVARVTAE